MKTAHNLRSKAIQLPKLAAMMLFFLGLSTNMHLDAAPAGRLPADLPKPHNAAQSKSTLPPPIIDEAEQIHVLSARDAGLYRAAFAAQEIGDWKAANDTLAQIKDKRLVGHVLADRYMRREMSLPEAQQWMATYNDLPEADALYDKAHSLKGFTSAHISSPKTALAWTGMNDPGASSGFRVQGNDAFGHKNHIDARINAELRHGDALKARELLTTEIQRGTLSVVDAGDIISHIAASFFYDGETERARDMAHTAAASGNPLGLWIAGLSAWKQQDFVAASRSFNSLAQSPGLSAWDQSAAAFWAYRAAKHNGDNTQARHWLAEAAKNPRSFYGYMAVGLTGHTPSRSWKMPELTAKNVEILAGLPAGWQALALVQIGKTNLAEEELHRLNPTGSHSVQTASLALAEQAHMTSLTLQLGGIATNDNGQPYDAALYPLPTWQPAGGFKVDRALMYALIKRESQFDPGAVSDRGACGLMQIMPSTARQISNDNNAGHDCPDRLFDPATNMEFGQKYVRVLAGQPMIGDNLLLLLAAYNGGPGNLAHWLDGDDRGDPLLFLETMPLHETRDYVQQVLLQYWVYRARLAEPETSVAQLARGEWPRYALHDESAIRLSNNTRGSIEVASSEPRASVGTR